MASLIQLQVEMEEELRPYGHYIAMRNVEEGSQPFTGAEIALAAIGIAAWCATQYVTGYLKELGRKHAAGREPAPDAADAQARSDAERLLAELRMLTDDAVLGQTRRQELDERWTALLDTIPQATPPAELDVAELENLLRRFGLTKRKAQKAAASIAQRMSES